MAERKRYRAELFVPELARCVRVRGFSLAKLPVAGAPTTMPAGAVDFRHPAILNLVSEGSVSPLFTPDEVAALSDETIELLAAAILRANPETRRLSTEAGGAE